MFFLLLASCSASVIHGRIKDSASGEELTGVTIYISGLNQATTSGLDGTYTIRGVNKGSYTVTASFISYRSISQNINIMGDSQDVSVDFFMVTENKTLGAVTVTGNLTGTQDASARQIEKKSDNMLNILSGRTIQLLPDVTVGNLLRRVSGVTVDRGEDGDGKYPVIRGMDRRYNYTLVNGMKIPSPDDKARYVPMDIFPSEMLQRLEVIKTLTPDMEADATGGVMNLVMKDAPEHFSLDAQGAIGYSQNAFAQSFIGYSANAVQLKSPAEEYGTNYMASSADFSKDNLNYKKSNSLPDGQIGFTVGDRFLHDKIGAILSGSWQSTDRINKEIFNNINPQPNPTPEPNTAEFDDIETRTYYTHSDRLGLHTKMDYEINENNKISFYGLLMQLNSYQLRTIIDTALGGRLVNTPTEVDVSYRSKTILQNIYTAALQGEHNLFHHLTITWSGIYSLATEQQPDVAELDLQQSALDSSGHKSSTPLIPVALPTYWQHNTDQNFSGFLNLHYKFKIGSSQFDIGTGGMYRHKYRENYFNDYTELQAFSPTVPFTNINSTSFWFPLGNGSQGSQGGDPNIYDITEDINAVYGELKWEYKRFSLLGGLRIENTDISYLQPNVPVTVVGKSGAASYQNSLPSVSLKYKLNEKSALHLSYFASITRPDFFEIVPYVFPGEYYTEVGNYNLIPSTADNIDLRYELFPGKANQLLVGAFYKNIQNPIEYVLQRYVISDQELQPVNDTLSAAVNYGLEITFTQYFHRFGISFNYTYTNSSVTNQEKVVELSKATGNDSLAYVNVKSPLQGQAANIGNISLIYKNPDPIKGMDLQLSAVYTGRFIDFLSPYEGFNQWELGSLILDFSGEKRINKHLAIYVKVNNILNTPKVIVMYQSNPYISDGVLTLPDQTSKNMIVIEKEYFGQTYLLGLRYKF